MQDVLTSDAMRALERGAMERGAVTGRALMERAGRGVAEEIRRNWPDRRRAVVLCGPGNNGGDGFVVARHLAGAGWRVAVFLLGAPDGLPPDAAANHAAWCRIGAVDPYDDRALQALRIDPGEAWVLVDALFGIGQRAPLDAVLAPVQALLARVETRPAIVAVDLPTGYDADTGATLATQPLAADLVVTFHAKKPIHAMNVLGDARIAIVDIGL
ncbi:NAD(P)H-hydrate epimerase [Roseivivax sp. CAU 1753]